MKHFSKICFADIYYVVECLVLFVKMHRKVCHACQVAFVMDSFLFQSISSRHVFQVQHFVYTTRGQYAILTEIIIKINFLVSVHQLLFFMRLWVYENVFL